MKLLNRYVFFARYLPGLITLTPAALLYFILTSHYTAYTLPAYLTSTTFIAGISGAFVLTFFVSMAAREFGTYLERRYFKNKLGFPTSYLMLYSNVNMPVQIKDRYGNNIKRDFGLNRLNAIEEQTSQAEALQILNHASRLLSTKYQQHEQVKDANISYGFCRNICGGLFISLPLAVIGITVGLWLKMTVLLFWSSTIFFILVMLAVLHKKWMTTNAEKYAEKLLSVYLSQSV